MNPLKAFLFFAVVSAVAVVAGVALADPLQRDSLLLVGLMLGVLAIPLLLRWNYWILVVSLYGPFILGFLPGEPPLWAFAAAATLGIAFFERTLNARREPILASTPGITRSLLVLVAVILLTGFYRDDFGGQVFGSENQGIKKYGYCLAAVAVYFAMASRSMDPAQGKRAITVMLLAGSLVMLTDFIWFMGPSARYLFLVIAPPSTHGSSFDEQGFEGFRFAGFAAGGLILIFLMVYHYGVKGLLDSSKWPRAVALLAVFALASLGGFRSLFFMVAILFGICGWLEGVHRQLRGWVLVIAGVMALTILVLFIDKMPYVIQRSLSMLPIKVDQSALADAQASTEWRLEMWKILWGEIPQYLAVGKGFGFSHTDYWFAGYFNDMLRQGSGNERSLLVGDYHSGPLTVLVPFGIPGALAFVAFIYYSWRQLRAMWLRGNPELRTVNRFLYGYFLTRLAVYIFIYGQFNLDLIVFTGLVGMSVAINRNYVVRMRGQVQLPATEPFGGARTRVPEATATALPLRSA
jgi:O-antigen ligase